MRVPNAKAQRVAVRGGARDAADGSAAVRPAHILYDDRLAERGLHPLGKNAPNRVGRSAGRVRHDYADGPCRISLCPGHGRDCREHGGSQDQAEGLAARQCHVGRISGAPRKLDF
jgi:hypothetical protein